MEIGLWPKRMHIYIYSIYFDVAAATRHSFELDKQQENVRPHLFQQIFLSFMIHQTPINFHLSSIQAMPVNQTDVYNHNGSISSWLCHSSPFCILLTSLNTSVFIPLLLLLAIGRDTVIACAKDCVALRSNKGATRRNSHHILWHSIIFLVFHSTKTKWARCSSSCSYWKS